MATSQSVAELTLKQWARTAGKLKLHLFPVPEDAFAEPLNEYSSPLRSPIFVDVDARPLPTDDTVSQGGTCRFLLCIDSHRRR